MRRWGSLVVVAWVGMCLAACKLPTPDTGCSAAGAGAESCGKCGSQCFYCAIGTCPADPCTNSCDGTSVCSSKDSTAGHENWSYCGSCATTRTCGYCPPGKCPSDPCSNTCDGSGGYGPLGGGGGNDGGGGGETCPSSAPLHCSAGWCCPKGEGGRTDVCCNGNPQASGCTANGNCSTGTGGGTGGGGGGGVTCGACTGQLECSQWISGTICNFQSCWCYYSDEHGDTDYGFYHTSDGQCFVCPQSDCQAAAQALINHCYGV